MTQYFKEYKVYIHNVVSIMKTHTHTHTHTHKIGPGLRKMLKTLALWNKIFLIFSFSVFSVILARVSRIFITKKKKL